MTNENTTPEAEKPAEPQYTTDHPSQQRVNQVVQPDVVVEDTDVAGSDQVKDKINEALEKGYLGTVPDETPNENYTVQGVTSGAPRPDAQEEPMSPGERA